MTKDLTGLRALLPLIWVVLAYIVPYLAPNFKNGAGIFGSIPAFNQRRSNDKGEAYRDDK